MMIAGGRSVEGNRYVGEDGTPRRTASRKGKRPAKQGQDS
jgi:hypothetical protein